MDIEFLPARVWQGLWTALFTVLLAGFDLCFLMKYVTRFTEVRDILLPRLSFEWLLCPL